jgi:hypothetical protein
MSSDEQGCGNGGLNDRSLSLSLSLSHFILFLVFELRASSLLGRRSTT